MLEFGYQSRAHLSPAVICSAAVNMRTSRFIQARILPPAPSATAAAADPALRSAHPSALSPDACAGHASSATVFSFYNSGYFIWSLYFRHRRSVMGRFVERRGWAGVFLKDMGQSIGFYWVLAQVRAPPRGAQ